MRHAALVALALLASAFLAEPALAGTGTFKNGKFNFCVSVRFNATEAQLTAIRARFERANQFLADVTDGQHQFGTIALVNNSGASDEAEFWIHPAGGRADAPAQYGIRGTHINLLFGSNFSSEVDRNSLTIVHEFAHSAYNVKDEYKKPAPPPLEPFASCPPPSEFSNPNLTYCIMDSYTRGSRLVSTTYSVTEFCVASNHDQDRDTDQSVYNHGESCWETMSRLVRPWRLRLPDGGLPQNPAPATQPVSFVSACPAAQTRRFMLLLDRSGSMDNAEDRFEGTRLNIAKNSVSHFMGLFNLQNIPGTFVGLASFATTARVDAPMVEVITDEARNGIKTATGTLASGGATNIGEGLLTAQGQLNALSSCGECFKIIILISDGDHNVGVPPESVIAELQQSGIKVIAVALGASISVAGEAALKNLAAQTGGTYLRAPTPPKLYNFMASLANDFGGYRPGVEIPIAVTPGARKEVPVFVEAGTTHTNFSVVTPDLADSVTLSLVKPSGAVIGEAGATGVVFAAEPNLRTFRVTAPEAGTWKLVINAGAIRTGDLTAMASLKHDGVYFHAWVDDEGTTFAPNPVALHASPAYDGRAVVGSVVTGTATRPDGTKTPIVLYDDGQLGHGDVTASDGVYSVLFDQYTKDGTYIFELTSQNTNGHLSEGEPMPNENGVVETFPIVPVPPFNRAAGAATVVAGLTEGDVVWVDDGVPQGATTQGEWYWVAANPAPVMGGAAHQSKISEPGPDNVNEHSFVGASARLPVAAGDRLFAYVFLDPNLNPDEIMLQWHADDGWEHRAYWGRNYVQLGVDGTNSRRFMGALPAAGRWVRLEVPAASVGLEGKLLDGMAFTTNGDRATWDRAGRVRGASPEPGPADFVWFDDSRPAGSVEENKDDFWEWVNIPGPYSGQVCHRSVLRGDTGTGRFRTHGFRQAQTPMKVEPGDVLYTYAYVDPNYWPDEIVLQWNDGDGWEHRAFWGNNFVDIGVMGTESRRFMGGLPPRGQWVRLEVPASYVGLEGKSVYGMSFGYYKQNDRARVSWDLAGKTSQPQTAPYPLSSLTPLWRFRSDSYGYSLSTNDIGRAEQSIQGIKAYVHPNQAAGTLPAYRFRDVNGGKYFYITRFVAPDSTWYYDGIAFYVYPQQVWGTVPMYQFYGKYYGSKEGYFYTTDSLEGASLGMSYQGILGYVHAANPLALVAPSDLFGYSGGIYWNDNSSNETGFEIEQFSAADGSWSRIAVVGPNVTNYPIARACQDSFRVRAFNAGGYSAYTSGGSGSLFDGKCFYPVPGQQPSPPSVTLVSPADGSTFKAGSTVQLRAEAFDPQGNGTIAKVEFFLQGGMKLGEATQPPYVYNGGNAPAGTYTVTATATDASGLSATSAPVTITIQPVNAGDVSISEFRFRGGGGQLDEFVELYNNTDFNITVSATDGSGGWSLVGSDGSARFSIPNGTLIPARGHLLAVNSAAYGLGAYAPGDTQWLGDIADGAGVALFMSASPSNFTTAYRLDAVGFGSVADARFREGAGLQPAAGVSANAQFSFLRRLSGGTPQDTNDNAADFLFVSTDGLSSGGAQSVLGAPGPEGLASPVQRTSSFGVTMLDPAVSSSSPPNRVRDLTSDPSNNSTFGTLSMRRTVTNNTGTPATRIRFRVVDITTYPVPSGVADMRLRSSPAVQVTRSDGSTVTVLGTTLETPPAQPNGGGFNSTVSVGAVTLAEPLQPGASVHVQFLLGLQSTGSFRFFINLEATQ